MAPKKSKNGRIGPPRKNMPEGSFSFVPRLDPAIYAAISADQPRGTKRSTTVAADIEEPNEDGDSESRKSVTPVRRRVRFLSPPESRPKQRRRVDDDLEATEAAPDEMWVAVGDDRCTRCKLMRREVCKPQRNGSGSCKSCVFCTGKTWQCNPPDSWLEMVASMTHPELPPANIEDAATDDMPIEASWSSETAEASRCATKVTPVRRQSGDRGDGGGTSPSVMCLYKWADESLISQAASNIDDRLQRIETRLSALERHQDGLTAIQETQKGTKAMLLALCRNQGIPPSIYSGPSSAADSTSTRSIDVDRSVSRLLFRRFVSQRTVANGQVGREAGGSSQQKIGGSASRSRYSALADAEPLAGSLTEPPKKSAVGTRRTQDSPEPMDVFIPNVEDDNAEDTLQYANDCLSAAMGELKDIRAQFSAIDRRLFKASTRLQDLI
ncbi:hypothetical protein EI94DRAFT_1732383 [Lactarius quietus]|nr:hypothetical protein EI94DRAFT_1732383 [Lactarius quietus]